MVRRCIGGCTGRGTPLCVTSSSSEMQINSCSNCNGPVRIGDRPSTMGYSGISKCASGWCSPELAGNGCSGAHGKQMLLRRLMIGLLDPAARRFNLRRAAQHSRSVDASPSAHFLRTRFKCPHFEISPAYCWSRSANAAEIAENSGTSLGKICKHSSRTASFRSMLWYTLSSSGGDTRHSPPMARAICSGENARCKHPCRSSTLMLSASSQNG